MKFCKFCGNKIDDNAIFCSTCGARVNGDNPQVNYNPYAGYGGRGYYSSYDNTGSILVSILCFLFPEAGLLLWFFWRFSRPRKARSATLGALSRLSLSMPVLGAVLWLVWKGDIGREDYAKVCGVSAIIGGAVYVLAIVAMIVLYLTGAIDEGFFVNLPLDGMAATLLWLR